MELVVGVLQSLNQLWDASLVDQDHLVVHILIDEIAGGTSCITLHFLVVAVEQLHQFTNALQVTYLRSK